MKVEKKIRVDPVAQEEAKKHGIKLGLTYELKLTSEPGEELCGKETSCPISGKSDETPIDYFVENSRKLIEVVNDLISKKELAHTSSILERAKEMKINLNRSEVSSVYTYLELDMRYDFVEDPKNGHCVCAIPKKVCDELLEMYNDFKKYGDEEAYEKDIMVYSIHWQKIVDSLIVGRGRKKDFEKK